MAPEFLFVENCLFTPVLGAAVEDHACVKFGDPTSICFWDIAWKKNKRKKRTQTRDYRRILGVRNKLAIADIVLPLCHHAANSTKHNFVLDFGPLAPLCKNMTSSKKPAAHNILHNGHTMTEPRPRVTCIGHLVKFGHVVFDIWERTYRHWQTNKQTNRHADRNTSPTDRGQNYICIPVSRRYKESWVDSRLSGSKGGQDIRLTAVVSKTGRGPGSLQQYTDSSKQRRERSTSWNLYGAVKPWRHA